LNQEEKFDINYLILNSEESHLAKQVNEFEYSGMGGKNFLIIIYFNLYIGPVV